MLLALLFAATLPDPNGYESMGWVAITLFGIAGGVNQVLKLTDRNKPTPALHQEYATKEEMRQVEHRFAAGILDLKKAMEHRDERVEEMVVRIHDRIDKQTTEIIDLIKETR